MSIREVWDVEACTDLSNLAAVNHPIKYERALKSLLRQLAESKQREADLQQAHCEATKWAVHIGLERDAALNALEIARKRIVEIWRRVDLGQREGALGIIGISLTEIDAIPAAALAERDQIRDQARDRVVERKTAERCRDLALTSKGYPTQLSEDIEREFNLQAEPVV